ASASPRRCAGFQGGASSFAARVRPGPDPPGRGGPLLLRMIPRPHRPSSENLAAVQTLDPDEWKLSTLRSGSLPCGPAPRVCQEVPFGTGHTLGNLAEVPPAAWPRVGGPTQSSAGAVTPGGLQWGERGREATPAGLEIVRLLGTAWPGV